MTNPHLDGRLVRLFLGLLFAFSATAARGGNLPNDPWGFTAADIYGQTLTPGSTAYDPNDHPQTFGVYSVAADGDDIWNNSDNFRYLYFPDSGDFSISVCVLANPFQGGNDRWAKAGLMVRQTNTAGAAFVAFITTRANGIALQWRDAQGASANWPGSSALSPVTTAYPIWLRLRRTSDLWAADYSYDGRNWQHRPHPRLPSAWQSGNGLITTTGAANILDTSIARPA